MEKVSIDKISPSMKSAVTVFDCSGKLIVDAGGVIDQEIVNQLYNEGYPGIYICDSSLNDIAFPFVIGVETRVQLIQYLKKIAENPNREAIVLLKEEYIANLINTLKVKNEIEVVPPEIRPQSILNFMHQVNVCILSILTAIKLNLSEDELEVMALEILLPQSFSTNNSISTSALEIIHLVKDFDNLVSGHDFFSNISTFHALKKIKEEISISYQPKIAEAFFQVVAPYPLGSKVKLNTGAIGVVLDINKTSIYKPIVRIIKDKCRSCETEIDLMKHNDCTILDVIN